MFGLHRVRFSPLLSFASSLTMAASFDYIYVFQPILVFLENLLKQNLYMFCLKKIRQLKIYDAEVFGVDNRHFSLPNSRSRMCLTAVNLRRCTSDTVSCGGCPPLQVPDLVADHLTIHIPLKITNVRAR